MNEYFSNIKQILHDLQHFMNENVIRIVVLQKILDAWSIGKEVGIILTQNSKQVIYSCDNSVPYINDYNNVTKYSNIQNNAKQDVCILLHHESKNLIKNISSHCSSPDSNNMENQNQNDNFDIINYHLFAENVINNHDYTNIGIKAHAINNSLNTSNKFEYHAMDNLINYPNSPNKLYEDAEINIDTFNFKDKKKETNSTNIVKCLYKYSEIDGTASKVNINKNNNIQECSESLILDSKEKVEIFEEEKYMQKLLAEEFNMKDEDNKKRYYYKGPFICLKCDSKFNCRSVFYKHKKNSHPHDSISTLLGRPRTYNRVFSISKKKKVPTATLR